MTSEQSSRLPEQEKLAMLKASKGSPWYDGWRPYCLVPGCRSAERMVQEPYGFRCLDCGNMIGFNLARLDDSPLNVPLAGDWRFGGSPDHVTFPAFFYAYDGNWKVTFCAHTLPEVWSHWMPAPVGVVMRFPPPPGDTNDFPVAHPVSD